MDASLPAPSDGVQWRHENGKDVSQWRHLGTRDLEGHGPVEFRARLHRYGDPGDWTIQPLVQYRTEDMDEWCGSFRRRNLQRVVQAVHEILDMTRRVLP
jgi:hypothetical protein